MRVGLFGTLLHLTKVGLQRLCSVVSWKGRTLYVSSSFDNGVGLLLLFSRTIFCRLYVTKSNYRQDL